MWTTAKTSDSSEEVKDLADKRPPSRHRIGLEMSSAPEVLQSGEEGRRRRSGENADVQALQLLLLHPPQRHSPHIIRPVRSMHPNHDMSAFRPSTRLHRLQYAVKAMSCVPVLAVLRLQGCQKIMCAASDDEQLLDQ